jgi:hypothetical protein
MKLIGSYMESIGLLPGFSFDFEFTWYAEWSSWKSW